jgi:hypothetical protein
MIIERYNRTVVSSPPTRLDAVLGVSVHSIAYLLRSLPRSRLHHSAVTRQLLDGALVNQRVAPLLRCPLWELHLQSPADAAQYSQALQTVAVKQATVSVRESAIARTVERMLLDHYPATLAVAHVEAGPNITAALSYYDVAHGLDAAPCGSTAVYHLAVPLFHTIITEVHHVATPNGPAAAFARPLPTTSASISTPSKQPVTTDHTPTKPMVGSPSAKPARAAGAAAHVSFGALDAESVPPAGPEPTPSEYELG